jgi:hypothetical protein
MRRIRATSVAGLVSLAAIGLGSFAAAGQAAVTFPRSIAVFYHRDFVTLTGYSLQDTITADVLRNGAVIGTSTGIVPVPDPKTNDPTVLINHPGGVCWENFTPELQPGDVVRTTITAGPNAGAVDFTTTANIDVTQTATIAGNGDVVVKGFAQDSAGNPLLIDQIQNRLISSSAQPFTASGRDLRAPGEGQITYDPVDAQTNPNGTNWTATYPGLTQADKDLAVASEARGLWLGLHPTLVNAAGFPAEMTFAEVGGSKPALSAPAPGCPAVASYAVTSVDAAHTFNGKPVVNVAGRDSALTVSGSSQSATAVTVTITDTSGSQVVAAPVTPAPGSGAQSWSATFTPAEVATLADGNLTASASYAIAGGNTSGRNLTIVKDMSAPPSPSPNVAPGTYPSSQSVTLADADPAAAVHYTVGGATPTAGSPTTPNPVSVTASQTIKAIAVDPVGNESSPVAFAYVISPPPPPPPPVTTSNGTTNAGGGATPAGGGTTATAGAAGGSVATAGSATATTSTRPALALTSLGIAPRMKRSKAQKNGLRLVMRLPEGTGVVKVNVYRKTGTGLKLLSSGLKAPSAAGLYRVAQNHAALRRQLTKGTYEVQVTPGYSKSELGKTTKASFRVV